jgi:hypothetical protein
MIKPVSGWTHYERDWKDGQIRRKILEYAAPK